MRKRKEDRLEATDLSLAFPLRSRRLISFCSIEKHCQATYMLPRSMKERR